MSKRLTLKLISLVIVIWISMNCLILVAIDHKNVPILDNPIPEWLRPGHIAPPMGSCEWRYLSNTDSISCSEDGVSYMYDLNTHIISHASISVYKKPVGDYLNSWGRPTGFSLNYHARQIYWGHLQIWTYGKHFDPYLPAFIISMSDEDTGRSAWHGFTNLP